MVIACILAWYVAVALALRVGTDFLEVVGNWGAGVVGLVSLPLGRAEEVDNPSH